jgi:nicotinate phosphoribosyltransferase
MIDYSLDIVEVAGEDRSKRGKRGGRKRLLELEDGSRSVVPAGTPAPEGARDLLQRLDELYSTPPDATALRERVLDQLSTGDYTL